MKIVAILLGLALPVAVLAQDIDSSEKVGHLTVEDVLLRPTYKSTESEGGQFGFGDSSFKVRWEKGQNISATIAVGSVLQKNVPEIYLAEAPADTLGFYEAYAEYKGVYGRVRAGLQPLEFGYYGSQPDMERIFPRPLLYQQRVIGLRDYGVGFYTTYNGYYTELIAHNGEVDQTAQDGDIWVTARWGWTNDRNIRVQFSGQTGHTKPVSTVAGSGASSTTPLAGWDYTRSALWRFGSLSAHWYPSNWEISAQVTAGERVQDEVTSGLISTQFEVINYMGDNWGAGLRHDGFDPNNKISGDKQTQLSGLIFVKSSDSTSLVSVVYSKNFEEVNEIPNDEVMVSWRLTPFVGR
jgi:hypothetical protein